MAAGRLNIHIERGQSFSLAAVKKLDGAPVDLTGVSAAMEVRASMMSPTVLVAAYSATTVGAGSIALNDPTGSIAVIIPPAVTEAISFESVVAGRLAEVIAVYDLVLTWPGGAKERLIEGIATISYGVTR